MGASIGPIQLIPPGLTGLLQLKQTGRLPSDLLGDVSPVLELRDWYMQSRQLQDFGLFGVIPATATFASNTNGFKAFQVGGAAFLVPQGQVWYVEQMTVIAALAAADTIVMAPCIAGPSLGANAEFTLVGPFYTDVITTRTRVAVAKADRSFWAYAGQQLGVWTVDNLAATTTTVTLHMRATPMPL